MKKRLSSRLLAVVLTIAICATAILGCLMSVSAADTPNLYSFSAGSVSTDKKSADITATFKNPTGGTFDSLEFVVSGSTDIELKEVQCQSTTVRNGNTIQVTCGNATQVDVVLTFSFNSKYDAAKTYDVKLTNVVMAIDGEYADVPSYTCAAGAVGYLGCEHATIELIGDPTFDADNNVNIYADSQCKECGQPFGVQVVPVITDDATAVTASNTIYLEHNGSNAGTKPTITEGQGNSEDNPIIIKTGANFVWMINAGPDETHGKYFKIADGIKNIVLQTDEMVKAAAKSANITPEQMVQKIIDCNGGQAFADLLATWQYKVDWRQKFLQYSNGSDTANSFCGTFDGNGATVYGMYIAASGGSLFGNCGNNATIKNLGIKNSYVKHWSSAIVANYVEPYTNSAAGTFTLENCEIANNYVEETSKSTKADIENSGLLIAHITKSNDTSISNENGFAIKNSLIYGNQLYVAKMSTNANFLVADFAWAIDKTRETETVKNEITNSVILDIDSFLNDDKANNGKFTDASNMTNVYTNCASPSTNNTYAGTTDVIQIDAANIKGSSAKNSMPNLEWDTVWFAQDGAYPVTEKFDVERVAKTNKTELAVDGANITYNNDGTINFNVYIKNTDTTLKAYIGDVFGNEMTAISADKIEKTTVNGTDVKKISIPNISAKNIGNTFAVTFTAQDGKVTNWGATKKISVADIARMIINGNNTDAQKSVAAALLNFGDAAQNVAANATNNNAASADSTIYWDPTATATAPKYSESENAYIIKNVAELIWTLKAGPAETKGKTFKIQDGIKNIVLQSEDFLTQNNIGADKFVSLNSAAETKDFYENTIMKISTSPYPNQWTADFNGFSTSDYESTAFCGTFDGNGATVYGLYGNGNNVSLFGTCGVDATIKNLAVKGSYIKSGWYGAALAARVVSYTYNDERIQGTIRVENCEIANNYFYNTSANAGENAGGMAVLFGENSATIATGGNTNFGVSVENIAVYDNEVYWSSLSKTKTPLFGNVNWAVYYENENDVLKCDLTNSIIFDVHAINNGTNTNFENYRNMTNVYVNTEEYKLKIKEENNGTGSYNEGQLWYRESSEAQGSVAKTRLPKLFEDTNTPWTLGAEGQYPTVVPTASMPFSYNTELQSANSAATRNEYGENNDKTHFGVGAVGLSLTTEPYFTFAFSFLDNGEKLYKTNRNDITITFKDANNNVLENSKNEQMIVKPPVYNAETHLSFDKDGWYTSDTSPRYHYYKLTDISIDDMVNGVKIYGKFGENGTDTYFGTFTAVGMKNAFAASYTNAPTAKNAAQKAAAEAFLYYVTARKAIPANAQ